MPGNLGRQSRPLCLAFCRLQKIADDQLHVNSYIHQQQIYIYIYTILKTPVSTVVTRYLFTNNP
jgi:hypothetical protein